MRSYIFSYTQKTLLGLDLESLDYFPRLLTDLPTSSENNKTFYFELRDDILWSDGEAFSAKDVLFTYKTIISPKIFTPYSSSFAHIESVKMINDYKIVVKYKYPYFKALETWMMEILPMHIQENEKVRRVYLGE